jgi:N-acetylmuramoyl-L-alanine amidase
MTVRHLVIFDRQHYGKPGRQDLGAVADLDGDGLREAHEAEANLTPVYIAAAVEALHAAGIDTLVIEAGSYADRHRQANAVARARPRSSVVYVACHLNAGGGSHGLVIHDPRSAGGKALAVAVADGLKAGLPELKAVKAASWEQGYPRAKGTIEGIYAGPGNISGVCFEPFFVDNPSVAAVLATPEGLARVGRALAEGVLRHLKA